MKHKGIIILVLAIFVLISVAGASASDANDTTISATDAQENFEINEDDTAVEQTDNILSVDDDLSEPQEEISTQKLCITNNEMVGKSITVSGNTFQDISNAIGGAEPGDTILLEGITYRGSGKAIEIQKSIALIGQEDTVLDAQGLSEILIDNRADSLVIKNITFVNGYSKTNLHGGAITLFFAKNCNISGCVFVKNSASNYKGGAIYGSESEGSISDCVFVNNSANDDAGAIYWNHCTGSISDCVFVNNSAEDKGAGIYWYRSKGRLSDCVFVNNSVINENGGALYWEGANGTVSDCIFINNTANFGGAIHWEGANGTLSGCIFLNNSADQGGGAIVWADGNGSLCDCVFANNSADQGGAVWWSGVNGSLSDCVFLNNSVINASGAIAWMGDNGCVSGCVFVNNSAREIGGAIGWWGLEGYVTSCVFVNNTSDNGSVFLVNYPSGTHFYFKFNNNIFLNHDKGSGISFYDRDSSSNIDYNWFGSTVGDYNVQPTFKKANANTWLFFNVTASSYTVPYLSSSKVTFKLYACDASGKISEYNNALLKPVNLTLSAINGDINVPVAIFGESFDFTAKAIGAGSVTASISNCNCTINLTLIKATVKVTSPNVKTTYNKNKYLKVTLTVNGMPISGEKITVAIKGAKTYTTDKNGQVKINLAKFAPKTYKVKIAFKGGHYFNPSQKTVKVSIKKAKAKIKAKKKTFIKSKKINKYTITLKSGKKAIKKAKITLKIKGKTYKAKTNKKGKATFLIKKLTQKGTFKATIKYKGNKYYKKTTKKVKIKVK